MSNTSTKQGNIIVRVIGLLIRDLRLSIIWLANSMQAPAAYALKRLVDFLFLFALVYALYVAIPAVFTEIVLYLKEAPWEDKAALALVGIL